jgi:hypothetical protein
MSTRTHRWLAAGAALVALVAAAGCGSSSGSAGAGGSGGPAAGTATGSPNSETSQAALAADAKSAATGDIPDTQNFLTLNARQLRVSMLYPEGWTVNETGRGVTISEKNNLVRIAIGTGAAPSVASVRSQLAALANATPGLRAGVPAAITLKSGPAVKVTYTTQSAPNPVTGKQVTLTVDRYVTGNAGRVATVDLGTPVGVDNVDAYRKMIESFRWL